MKTRQYCSVCKEWLDMEVVPTSDGDDDDSVAWYRCPQCHGFLPKLKSGGEYAAEGSADVAGDSADAAEPIASETEDGDPAPEAVADIDIADLDESDTLPWDSPADMAAAQKRVAESDVDEVVIDADIVTDLDLEPADQIAGTPEVDEALASKRLGPADDDIIGDAPDTTIEAPEPVHEYAALLAEQDPFSAVPYRPWDSYELDQCIHHLAWDDCGVVVAKEDLPGGRKIIKVYFEEAGVVRLIEQDKN